MLFHNRNIAEMNGAREKQLDGKERGDITSVLPHK
jgi:hypothetical protein